MPTEYDITAAFEAIENELISSMMRNMKRHRAEEDEEGIQWSQWQAEQLQALEEYKRHGRTKFRAQFQSVNKDIETLLREAKQQGGMEQEETILRAIQQGATLRPRGTMDASFFRINERKLDALIQATTEDMTKAETAILRRADDQYRKVIFNAQVYANTGAGTYEKAVDMATKDFLSNGIQCVVYSNGARHTLADYAEMALRTASKRAYLQGEGQKRQEWGVTTVILNKRGNACPKCAPFCGQVFIDDVWSGGKASDGDYPLLSSAIAKGLYHPRCKDSHTTYFEGITEEPKPVTKVEREKLVQEYNRKQKQQYARRQAKKYRRLAEHSLDEDNRRGYVARAQDWETVYTDLAIDGANEKTVPIPVANSVDSGILKAGTQNSGGVDVHYVGKLDRDIYRCVTEDIVTDEVIITDERIGHIKERHPNDFERYERYITEAIASPDFILEANRPNTAFVLKQIQEDEKQFELILRLKVSGDPDNYKNSVITFLKISEKKWNKYLRNKNVLYKKE